MNIRTTFFKLMFIFTMIFSSSILAQQEAQFTQYMYNTLAINPAYAGSRGGLSIAGLYRSQWVGLDGAPITQTFNIHSPIANRLGFGLSVVNDEIGNGTSQETYLDGTFSYTVQVSSTANLNFGLKAGGHYLNIDLSKLQNRDSAFDNGQQTVIDNKFSPNFGLGIYYYTEKFYAGASVPNILETEHFDSTGQSSNLLSQERMNLYFLGGFVFDLSSNVKFKPAFLAKAVTGAPIQLDLSANFMFSEKFILGGAYRLDAAWSGLAGFQFNNTIMLGLAYDREITELGSTAFNNGSFEVFLRFDFLNQSKAKGNHNNKVLTPRFF